MKHTLLLSALLLTSCQNGRFAGLTPDQWLSVARDSGAEALRPLPVTVLRHYTAARLSGGKSPLPADLLLPDVVAETLSPITR